MKNLKKIITVAAIVFAATLSNAQKNENSLLWKVEGNDIKTAYVFGTFHMLPEKDFIFKDKVKRAIADSELIVLEVDMDSPSMQSEMLKHSAMPEGKTLVEFMNNEEYLLIDTYLKEKIGTGLEAFKKYKPLMVSSMIMMGYLGENHASYEATILAMAKEQQKEIKGLETIGSQMQAIDKQSYELQLDDIVKLLNDKEGMSNMFHQMITNYKAEDIDGLYSFMVTYFTAEGQMDALLHTRNANWIPKIEAYSKAQSVFYGVGAGHLGGELGVVNLLRRAGYIVTPVVN